MGGKKGGENTKKAAGNARKAEVAAQKQAEQDSRRSKAEDEEWSKGAKSTAKKDNAEAKKAEAARKKAEKEALIAEEERTMKAAKTGNAKTATKKNVRGGGGSSGGTLDLSQLDADADVDSGSSSTKQTALTASGIDNALDALTLTTTTAAQDKIDRHPERRYKAAYAAYEARRLPEIEEEQKGLRRQQRIDIVRKEFEKHPDNPFNQVSARFDASKQELDTIRQAERRKIEERLAAKS